MSALELVILVFIVTILSISGLVIMLTLHQKGAGGSILSSVKTRVQNNLGLEVMTLAATVLIALTLDIEWIVTVCIAGIVLGYLGPKRLKTAGWIAFGTAVVMLLHFQLDPWYVRNVQEARAYLNKPAESLSHKAAYREMDNRSRPSAPPKGSRLNPYTLKKGEIIERVFTPGETVYVQMPQHITSCNGQSLTATDLGGALFRYKNETGEKQSSYAFAGPCSKLPPQ